MKRAPKIEVYQAADGWRWRLRSTNGRILCQGEAHGSRRDARRAALGVQRAFAGAVLAG
jgi:uncharacterized protein YegP (UPF0339 family)